MQLMNASRVCLTIMRYYMKRKKKNHIILSDDTDVSQLSYKDIAATSFDTSWFRYVTQSFVDRWNILVDDWRHCHGRGERTAFVGSARATQPCFSFSIPHDDEEEPIIVDELFKSLVLRTHVTIIIDRILNRIKRFDYENVCPEFVEFSRTIERFFCAHWWHVKQPTGSL